MTLLGPFHEFYVLSSSVLKDEHFWMANRPEKPIKLADDLYSCLKDYFEWVETKNPATSEPWVGLCRWGVTLIDSESSTTLNQVLADLKNLFKHSPDEVVLTGDWEFNGGDDPYDGAYQKIKLSRNDMLLLLSELESMALDVSQSSGNKVILHRGV